MAQLDAEQFSQHLKQLGVPSHLAAETASHMDDRMKNCILRLYRSAVHVGGKWEPDLARVTSPGLVLWGVSDPACPAEFADRLGRATKARRVLKLDAGHWFLLENQWKWRRLSMSIGKVRRT